MRVLCLDLSTRSGWALLLPDKIVCYGKFESKVVGGPESQEYPFNFLNMAQAAGVFFARLAFDLKPDVIVIEETNKGKNRYSQKQLEFIHYAVCEALRPNKAPIKYLSTSEWRKNIELDYDKDHRLHNKEHNGQRRDRNLELMRDIESCFQPEMNEDLESISSKRDRKKHKRAYDELIGSMVREYMGKFRVRIEGKVSSKVDKKLLSVQLVNRVFSTKFKKPDNDICDAICLGLGYYQHIQMENAWAITRTKSSEPETK